MCIRDSTTTSLADVTAFFGATVADLVDGVTKLTNIDVDTMDGKQALNLRKICLLYTSIHAIKDVSFRVFDGEIVALIGANGAGKSTTLKTVSGLLRSNTGSIRCV